MQHIVPKILSAAFLMFLNLVERILVWITGRFTFTMHVHSLLLYTEGKGSSFLMSCMHIFGLLAKAI